MRETLTAVRLALADFGFEWRLSACLVLGLAAVLAPLMVLFGLKYGIVEAIRAPMLDNPAYRQISPVGAGRFDTAWFDAMRADSAVAFIVPRTRSISATVRLRQPERSARRNLTVELIPSGAGDPVLGDRLAGDGAETQLVLSASAATKLGSAPGERLEAFVTRTRDGRREQVSLMVTVLDVAEPAAFGRDGAFARLSLLEAVEDYRDGIAVPRLDWTGTPSAGPRTYGSYRLYATQLADVAGLRRRMEDLGLSVSTRASDIAVVQSLDRNLTLVFWIVAAIGGIGYLLSLGASLWSAVERKRKELSVLRLVGLGGGALLWFPVTQALALAVLGSVVASAAALGIAQVLNSVFADVGGTGQFISRLQADHLLAAIGITLLGALAASALAAVRCLQVDPAEGLRDV